MEGGREQTWVRRTFAVLLASSVAAVTMTACPPPPPRAPVVVRPAALLAFMAIHACSDATQCPIVQCADQNATVCAGGECYYLVKTPDPATGVACQCVDQDVRFCDVGGVCDQATLAGCGKQTCSASSGTQSAWGPCQPLVDPNCGLSGNACCPNGSCRDAGLTCQGGVCRPVAQPGCGSAGKACCPSAQPCDGSSVCVGSTCVACGAAGQPCCQGGSCGPKPPNGVCGGGLACPSGTCVATSPAASCPKAVAGVGPNGSGDWNCDGKVQLELWTSTSSPLPTTCGTMGSSTGHDVILMNASTPGWLDLKAAGAVRDGTDPNASAATAAMDRFCKTLTSKDACRKTGAYVEGSPTAVDAVCGQDALVPSCTWNANGNTCGVVLPGVAPCLWSASIAKLTCPVPLHRTVTCL